MTIVVQGSSNLLSLQQSVMQELGLATSLAQVVGNSSSDVTQIYSLFNNLGRDLLRHDWEFLATAYRFTTQYLTTTGDIVSGSPTIINIPSTTGLDTSYQVASGVGINQDTLIQSVDSSTQVTLTQNATITQAQQTLQFQKVKYSLPVDWD